MDVEPEHHHPPFSHFYVQDRCPLLEPFVPDHPPAQEERLIRITRHDMDPVGPHSLILLSLGTFPLQLEGSASGEEDHATLRHTVGEGVLVIKICLEDCSRAVEAVCRHAGQDILDGEIKVLHREITRSIVAYQTFRIVMFFLRAIGFFGSGLYSVSK
jgi:hypothetical protein